MFNAEKEEPCHAECSMKILRSPGYKTPLVPLDQSYNKKHWARLWSTWLIYQVETCFLVELSTVTTKFIREGSTSLNLVLKAEELTKEVCYESLYVTKTQVSFPKKCRVMGKMKQPYKKNVFCYRFIWNLQILTQITPKLKPLWERMSTALHTGAFDNASKFHHLG